MIINHSREYKGQVCRFLEMLSRENLEFFKELNKKHNHKILEINLKNHDQLL